MTPDFFNRWRIIPRICVALYCWTFFEVSIWFMGLPNPNGPQAAFVSTVVGASAAFFNFYVKSGTDDK